MRILSTLLLIFFSSSVAVAQPESSEVANPYAQFSEHSAATRYRLDHQPWTDFLRRAVYITGRSNREPAQRDTGYRNIGTRLSTSSRSRYRFEANRVLYREFTDEAEEYLALYRQALQDTINRIDYGALSRDEQLAFWLNLHNVVVMDEIAHAHPVSRPSRVTAGANKEKLFDAKLVTVHGVALSLNDIRFNILYRYWRDPDVMYGLWTGEIGSPDITKRAFEGASVRAQLRDNGRTYVNSLRGIDRIRGELRLSPMYYEARPYFFSDWPAALYAHLGRFARGDAADVLALAPENPKALRFDKHTADAASGERINARGNDNAAAVAAGADLGRNWGELSSTGLRSGFPSEARRLQREIEQRNAGRVGTVEVIDIHTDDTGESLKIETDENVNRDEATQTD